MPEPVGKGQRIPAAGGVFFDPGAPVPVETKAHHVERMKEEGVVIEDRSQPEGRAVMADPEIERAQLEFQEGVIELGLEFLVTVGIPGEAGLDGQDGDVAAPPGKALNEIESQAGFLHRLHRAHRIGDGLAGGRGVPGDSLNLKEKEGSGSPKGEGRDEKREKSREGKNGEKATGFPRICPLITHRLLIHCFRVFFPRITPDETPAQTSNLMLPWKTGLSFSEKTTRISQSPGMTMLIGRR